jgi:hypothetical protein
MAGSRLAKALMIAVTAIIVVGLVLSTIAVPVAE